MADESTHLGPRLPLPRSLLAGLLAACASAGQATFDGSAAERMARLEEEVASGRVSAELDELAHLREADNLAPEQLERVDRVLLRGGLARIEAARGDVSALKRIYRSDLPRRVRARAGILAADALLEGDHPVKALNQLQKVDRKFPHHAERALAGDVLARIGLDLIRREGRYSLLFRYRPKGIKALEYLVVRYPLNAKCDEAYYLLSEAYEADDEIDYAIDRTEDLLVYHPDSPYVVAAQARLPYLRLKRLERDDYERGQLVTASKEIEDWLARYPAHELAGWVRDLREACSIRLAENDLSLARYYERIGSEVGRDLHARRALGTAREARLDTYEARALALLGPETALPEDWMTRPASSAPAPTQP